MPTLKQEFIYFNDAVGRTLPNAKMYFYAAGTTSPKNTYTTKALTSPNPHPVVADAAGRFPVIWLETGGYRVVVEDANGVEIHDRDDINVADEQLNATSSIYFSTLADMKLLIAQNGQNVNPTLGSALRTAGKATSTDDLGAEWIVVAAGTGTPDDDTYVNLDNGLQAERVFNQLYRKNNGSDIEDPADFRTNISVYSKAESDTRYINDEPNSVTTSNVNDLAITEEKLADDAAANSKINFFVTTDDYSVAAATTTTELLSVPTGVSGFRLVHQKTQFARDASFLLAVAESDLANRVVDVIYAPGTASNGVVLKNDDASNTRYYRITSTWVIDP